MSERALDKQGRWRCKNVNFRMSPEEAELLDTAVKLSGLTKQEYLVNRVLNREIIEKSNPRIYKALKTEMDNILSELRRMESCSEANPDFLAVIELVAVTVEGMKS
ncbi:MAG: hypothetical protein IKK85_00260 [Clostridia bacterium]|nr:hypothetical protein [Clostridia bacterium]